MTEQANPDDTPVKRFFTFWWGLGVFFAFGALALIIGAADTLSGGGKDEYETRRAADRYGKLQSVREAQAKLLGGAGEPAEGSPGKIRIPVEVAAQVMVKELRAGSPAPTSVPVPGTAAMEELMKKQAEEAAAAEAAKPKEDKPAEPANPK